MLGLLGLHASPVRAERGALTLEVALGAEVSQTGVPQLDEAREVLPVGAASGRLSLFSSLEHGFELGISLRGSTSRKRTLTDAIFGARSGTYLEHLSEGGAFALARLSGFGLISRLFFELGLGTRIARHTRRELLKPSADGGFTSFKGMLEDTTVFMPGATASLGWQWLGDRLAFGLRIGGALARSPERWEPAAHLELTTAWSFYP